jgi:hypothetical protein
MLGGIAWKTSYGGSGCCQRFRMRSQDGTTRAMPGRLRGRLQAAPADVLEDLRRMPLPAGVIQRRNASAFVLIFAMLMPDASLAPMLTRRAASIAILPFLAACSGTMNSGDLARRGDAAASSRSVRKRRTAPWRARCLRVPVIAHRLRCSAPQGLQRDDQLPLG